MLRSIKDLISYPVHATDGKLGSAKDALFDDRFWTLRYLVVDTGKWLPGRKVLVSPLHLRQPEVGLPKHRFPVDLTKEQIENCPELDADAPVSRQYEEEFARYYNHDFYWIGPHAFGDAGMRYAAAEPTANVDEQIRHTRRVRQIEDSHLRSAREVMGYRIDALDDEFGHVEDFIMDDETWMFRLLVVDSRNWLPGKKFLVDINWIQDLDWPGEKASVRLKREKIESAPEYDPHELVNEDYLNNLYDYYGHPRIGKDTRVAPGIL